PESRNRRSVGWAMPRRTGASAEGSPCGASIHQALASPMGSAAPSLAAERIGYASGGAIICPKPMQKVSRSRTVIGRFAGTVSSSGPFESLQDLAIGQFGEQSVYRIVQPQLAFLHKDHRRNSDDWLGHGGDAKDRVVPHWGGVCERLLPDHIDMHLAP